MTEHGGPGRPGGTTRRELILSVAGTAVGALLAGCSPAGRAPSTGRAGGLPAHPPIPTRLPAGAPPPVGPAGLVTSAAVLAENARPGTTDWVPTGVQTQAGIEGYTDRTSATPGQQIALAVSTTATRYRVQIYRLGWYGGLGARLLAESPELPGSRYPVPAPTTGARTVACTWPVGWRFTIGADWLSGAYLAKLVGDAGQQHLTPFTVRDDTSTSAYLAVNAVTTWQAYNTWGGYSLYLGRPLPGSSRTATRAGAC